MMKFITKLFRKKDMTIYDIHGSELISRERSRQIKEKGYSKEGDEGFADALTHMAAAKLNKAFDILMVDDGSDEDAIEHLQKAGALCAAAIDAIRYDRGRKDGK